MKRTLAIPGILALILGGWLAASPGVRADIVTFQGGEQLHGNIYRQDGEYLSMRLVNGGDVVISRDLVRSVVKEPPETFYVKRGDMFLERKEYSKALVEYLQAAQRAPGQDWIQEKIDQVNRLRGEEITQGVIRRAKDLLDQGAFRQAIGLLQDAAAEVPQGEIQRALMHELAIAQSQLAYHYFNHCFEELALEELAKAEEFDPYCADVYYVLGRINHTQSRFQTARREYQRALDLDPALEQARDSLLKLEKDMQRFRTVF